MPLFKLSNDALSFSAFTISLNQFDLNAITIPIYNHIIHVRLL